ncbi:hypothetical protein HZA45_02400 [Candidatus Peregrinibacteria bacterium]|nr:hypothetical protein [Candidatus Peregrinibacteria bacterium]
MMDLGGSESFVPSEGEGGGSEAAREQAQQRFAGTAAALQQIRREEKKAKRQDDSVAQAILQFLTDNQRTHLATLISRLVGLNCPSVFILSVVSLINPQCAAIVAEYLKEAMGVEENDAETLPATLAHAGELGEHANRELALWTARMDLVLQSDRQTILRALVVADNNIDGTVLQLTTFVLQEFLQTHKKQAAFEKLQPLAIGILHSLFEPHLREYEQLNEESSPPPAGEG